MLFRFVMSLLVIGFSLSAVAKKPARKPAQQSSSAYCESLKSLAAQRKVAQYKCGITRGPVSEKKIALVFTAAYFGEGHEAIRKALKDVDGKASFFLAGSFLRQTKNQPIIQALKEEGHFLGPHGDRHLLLVDEKSKTKVTREAFMKELNDNIAEFARFGLSREDMPYWIVSYETYNTQISQWSQEAGVLLFNYSEGTRTNADYTGDKDKIFISNETIEASIMTQAAKPNGLNGFLMLLHLGVGPKRSQPFHHRLGTVLKTLQAQGYSFVRVDELLDPALN